MAIKNNTTQVSRHTRQAVGGIYRHHKTWSKAAAATGVSHETLRRIFKDKKTRVNIATARRVRDYWRELQKQEQPTPAPAPSGGLAAALRQLAAGANGNAEGLEAIQRLEGKVDQLIADLARFEDRTARAETVSLELLTQLHAVWIGGDA